MATHQVDRRFHLVGDSRTFWAAASRIANRRRADYDILDADAIPSSDGNGAIGAFANYFLA